LLNVEEPRTFLFRRFAGDGSSFTFHLHEVVGWGVPFLDNAPMWRNKRHATDDPDIVIPGPLEALLVTLAHWFYEDKALSLGNLLLTAHALRSMEGARRRGVARAGRLEEGFGVRYVFEEAWKGLFGAGFLNLEQHAELARAPARYAAVRVRLLPYVRYQENDIAAQLPFKACKVAYYRKVMRDRRRSHPRKWFDVFDTLLWAVRWKLHVRSQPGLLVTVSGVDGSGKSLQVERLRGAFETCDVRVRCVWARGASSKGVGTVLRAGKAVLVSTAPEDAPTPRTVAEAARAHGAASGGEAARFEARQRRLKNPVVRWVFSVVYALDLVWPYVVRARAGVLTGHVVICDRTSTTPPSTTRPHRYQSGRAPFALKCAARAGAAILASPSSPTSTRTKRCDASPRKAAPRTWRRVARCSEIAKSHRSTSCVGRAGAEEIQKRWRDVVGAFNDYYGTLMFGRCVRTWADEPLRWRRSGRRRERPFIR
jgi:hypothetical protein